MIDERLFGKTRAGILREVYLNPDKRVSFNELVRRLRTGDGAVARELKNLIGMGLLTEEREGSHRFLKAAKSSPLFNELKSLVTKASGPAKIIRESLRDLGKDIDVALIFGSVAKGTERAESDLDLFVVGKAGYSAVADCVRSVEKRLGRRVQVLYYDSRTQADRASLRKPSVHALLDGPRRFVVGGERELNELLAKRKQTLGQPKKSRQPHARVSADASPGRTELGNPARSR
jgi:predicted nucleotidyltransferase